MLHAAQELLACLVLLGNALNPGTLLRVPLLKASTETSESRNIQC